MPKLLHVVWLPGTGQAVMYGDKPFHSMYGSSEPMVDKALADQLAEALRTITAPVDGSVPIIPIGEWMIEARAALAAYNGGEDGGT